MGSGVGLWALNLESLAKSRPVYAFDLLGFGRSSRPAMPKDPLLAEAEFVESIESWRKEMNLDKFIILGHSLGGFLVTSYALRYPEHIQHLVLVDPWGFQETKADPHSRPPLWVRAVGNVVSLFNPLSGVRAAGPWGPNLVRWFRPDMERRFTHLFTDDTVCQYIYHCNAQNPSGEVAFKHLTEKFGWAKHPMINRVTDLPVSLPISVIYGARSWVDYGIGYEIQYLRNESYVDVQVFKGAGHHVYADRSTEFNAYINKLCSQVDESNE